MGTPFLDSLDSGHTLVFPMQFGSNGSEQLYWTQQIYQIKMKIRMDCKLSNERGNREARAYRRLVIDAQVRVVTRVERLTAVNTCTRPHDSGHSLVLVVQLGSDCLD